MNWPAMLRTISLLAIFFQTTSLPLQSQDVTPRLELAKRLKPLPDQLVVLTFDDAVSSHATFVAPLLKKYGFGGTFFICEFPPDFDSDKKKYMTWEQIRSLHEMGFEVASHTHTHANVAKLTREQLVQELAYIEDRCLELGISRPVSFAYPGYETHPDALQILTQRGYLFARAGEDRTYRPFLDHPLLVPSFSTTGPDKKRVLDALKQAKNGEIVVLTVHGVPDYAHPRVTTPPELFETYLDYLKDNHYTVAALRDLAQFIDPGQARKVPTGATHSSKQ